MELGGKCSGQGGLGGRRKALRVRLSRSGESVIRSKSCPSTGKDALL